MATFNSLQKRYLKTKTKQKTQCYKTYHEYMVNCSLF